MIQGPARLDTLRHLVANERVRFVACQSMSWLALVPLLGAWLLLSRAGMPATEFGSPAGIAIDTMIIGAVVLIAVHSVVRSDSDRRRAAQSLRAGESRFRALIEHASDGIALMAADGTFTYHSPAAERLLGIEPGSIVGRRCADGIHADDRDAALRALLRIQSVPGAREPTQLRVRHRDGSWRWIEATVANLLDDPAVRSIVANYRDVTDRRASETALRESEQRFREMAEHIREAFFVLDTATGTPLYVSPTWSEIWARPIEEGYDQHTWIGSLHPDDQAEMHNVIARNIAGEPTDHVFRVMRPDGSPRWVRGRAFPVRNEQGEVYRVVGVAKDITELREVEQRFTEAQKLEAVARLAGGVAHDFNNLLTVILAEAEMIRDSLKPASDENKLMGELLAAAQSAATLTRQLLAFSRRQLVEPTVFSINDAVDKTNKMLRRVIGEDISLSTVLAPNAGSVRMDAGHFEQVLTNLAVNARDAMPNGGSLEIRTQQIVVTARGPNAQSGVDAGHYALVSVTDSGIGMSQETLSRVFEPFFTTKERGKGTGLGLATCHGITKQAGGHIFARSAPGKGTTIDVYLPFVAPEAVESAAPEPIAPRGTESILLVEDDDAVRRVATRMLRGQGYTVTDAPTAAAALRCILQAPLPPELLLTDVVLPGMGGRELAERVRAVLPSVKVLFMTGYSDDSVLREQLAAHDASLLRKPYTTTSLAIRVRELLDAPVRHAPGLRAG